MRIRLRVSGDSRCLLSPKPNSIFVFHVINFDRFIYCTPAEFSDCPRILRDGRQQRNGRERAAARRNGTGKTSKGIRKHVQTVRFLSHHRNRFHHRHHGLVV